MDRTNKIDILWLVLFLIIFINGFEALARWNDPEIGTAEMRLHADYEHSIRARKRILIADDIESNREILGDLLSDRQGLYRNITIRHILCVLIY